MRRRGTVLVIIIGALALLSVITVAYVSVGKGDRRSAAVVERDSGVDETVRRVADYIATDVIAADLLSVHKQETHASQALTGVFAREAWDYPYTPWLATSNDNSTPSGFPADRVFPFSPVGTLPADVNPFDGSAMDDLPPIPGSDPWLADTAPTWLNYAVSPPTNPGDNAWRYENARDWGHISNIAPDGRFVNLWNLRGDFDAGPDDDGDQIPDLSENLTLFDAQGVQTEPGSSFSTDFGIQADLDVPAHWDSRQQWMFRAARDVNNGPSSPKHLPYQYADADGDGIFDSRWQALVDNSDMANNNTGSVLPQNGRYRWFVATRIVDLSSLVNVNTATGMTAGDEAPDDFYPVGHSPADVDLVRLLSGVDVFDDQLGFGAMLTQELDIPEKYEEENFLVTRYRDNLDGTMASRGARWSWSGLWVTIQNNEIPDREELDFPFEQDPELRAEFYERYGAHFDAPGLTEVSGADLYGNGGRFGLSDQFELMTRRGANDDTQTSRLERAMGGRLSLPGGRWYSPLRDNWPTSLETGVLDNADRNGNDLPEGDGFVDPQDMLKQAWDVRRHLTVLSGARSLRSGPIPAEEPGDPDYEQLVVGAMRGLDGPVRDVALDAVTELRFSAGFVEPVSGEAVAPDAGPLYEAYADALAPYLRELEDQDWSDPASSTLATTTYGDSPEFSLLTAAHLAANAIDAYDTDDVNDQRGDLNGDGDDEDFPTRGPSAFTLVLDDTFPQNSNTYPYPWPQLRLDESKLPGSAVAPSFADGAVNVYGIEAQPFLTEVASFIVYTDTPVGAGGDSEGVESDGDGGDIGGGDVVDCSEQPPITISGVLNTANDDLVMWALVFQLSNPFDEEVHLSGNRLSSGEPLDEGDTVMVGSDPGTNEFGYYIEYAGEFYKVVDDIAGSGSGGGGGGPGDGASASTLEAVTLEPGQTRNFVALSDTIASLRARWNSRLLGGTDFASDEEFRDYLDEQLAVYDSTRPDEIVLLEPFSPDSGMGQMPSGLMFGPGTGDTGEVRLWLRKDPADASYDRGNHVLADRLAHTDMQATLKREFGMGTLIDGTQSGFDPTEAEDPKCPDNSGFSIVMWGSVSRPSDPATDGKAPLGALPAWCVERRTAAGSSLNETDTDGVNIPSKGDFTTGDTGRRTLLEIKEDGAREEDTFDDVDAMDADRENAFIDTIVQDPDSKDVIDIDQKAALGLDFTRRYAQVQLSNEQWRSDPPAQDEFSRLRRADMLLPLAIGPTFNPAAPGVTGGDTAAGWVTLSEALCGALGYELPGGGNPGPFDDLDVRTDRGNLRIDDYVAYEDLNLDREYQVFVEPRRGTGLPLALNVIEAFKTLDPRFGSIVKPTYGVVNINTAPLEVLRTLPMLSPARGRDAALPGMPDYWWWGPASANLHDERSDIATTVAAYRDKRALWPRTEAAPNSSNALHFGEGTSDQNGQSAQEPISSRDPTDATSREARTEILGVRETPGFASVGEILNARDFAYQAGLGGGGGQYNFPHDIDRLGVAGENPPYFTIEEDGVESLLLRGDTDDDGYPNGNAARSVSDEIENDYDQKLAIANGLLNTISVRSDLYAVWFIVHGYQQEDVEGLRPAEPMVPSVARRYLMIVDRSTVTDLGDKPRIVAIKQLPL